MKIIIIIFAFCTLLMEAHPDNFNVRGAMTNMKTAESATSKQYRKYFNNQSDYDSLSNENYGSSRPNFPYSLSVAFHLMP
ncbi:MAG: hypothetical protein QM764_05710 [Chitinophagaceae bacterium]